LFIFPVYSTCPPFFFFILMPCLLQYTSNHYLSTMELASHLCILTLNYLCSRNTSPNPHKSSLSSYARFGHDHTFAKKAGGCSKILVQDSLSAKIIPNLSLFKAVSVSVTIPTFSMSPVTSHRFTFLLTKLSAQRLLRNHEKPPQSSSSTAANSTPMDQLEEFNVSRTKEMRGRRYLKSHPISSSWIIISYNIADGTYSIYHSLPRRYHNYCPGKCTRTHAILTTFQF